MTKRNAVLTAVLAGCFLLTTLLLCACNGGQGSGADTTGAATEPASEIDADTQEVTEMQTDDKVGSIETAAPETTAEEETTEAVTEEETYEVRLYSLMPESGSLMQSFVLRTKHGKLIVIDGGIDGDGFTKKAYMPAALRAIAGVGQSDYVEVEAWFLSHAHKDHFNELLKTLNEYTDDRNFVIKNFYFDFPDYGTESFPADTNDRDHLEQLKAALDNYAKARGIAVTEGSTYYEDLNGAVINQTTIDEGFEMEIDGVRIEFMQTWSVSDGANVNNSSLIFRMWVEGQSILFLQDTATARGVTLLEKYGDKLKSDIVQMAHHGQGGVREAVYKAIDASVRIWPTPLWVWNNTSTYEIGVNRKWVHGGVDFTAASEYDIVTCLYPKFPSNRRTVVAWEKVLDHMYIPLPYPAVDTAPDYMNPPDKPGQEEQGPAYKSENPVKYVGTFTNFDSMTTLTESSGTFAYGGSITGDIHMTEGATGSNVSKVASVTLADGKGYNGSTALQVSATTNSNQALYLFATDANKNVTDYPSIKYLRVWVDFTNMDFRKATFGLITDKGEVFTVGEKDFENTPIYYLPEGETEWKTFAIGADGCFGQQEGPSVLNFKGWMAFPTKDFNYWVGSGNGGSSKGDAFSGTKIVGVYLFWCYAQNADHKGKPFYLDEIQLVKDYKVFEEYSNG